jgi:hypothetical protein
VVQLQAGPDAAAGLLLPCLGGCIVEAALRGGSWRLLQENPRLLLLLLLLLLRGVVRAGRHAGGGRGLQGHPTCQC